MRVRTALPKDRATIEDLCQHSSRTTARLWWWEEHLGAETFVVTEMSGIVRGVLFAWADGSPIAWTRLAALDDLMSVADWLALSLPPVIAGLRRQHARGLAWLDHGGWAGPHLEEHGFVPLTQVITLVKRHRRMPPCPSDAATVRPATRADVPATIAIDQAAFSPHWWHSTEAMFRKMTAATHFLVALRGGAVVGYVEGTAQGPRAHINRLAVLPAHQNQGVGTTLLHHILTAFWRDGIRTTTLNTQSDNEHARNLYRRFGFQPTGDSTLAWELTL